MQNKQHPLSALCAVALTALAPCAVLAQDPATAPRTWALESNVSLRQTFTDNQRLQTVKESDAITEASAGVRLTGSGGRVRGFLDYALIGSVYARNNDANDLRHVLNTAATAELIEGQAFVDLRGSYARQAISAFGSQSGAPGLTDANQSDVASLSISPHLRGRLGGTLRYAARLSHDVTRAKGTDAGDGENSAASLRIDGGAAGSPLAWSADASHNISDFRVGRRTYDSRARVGLSYLLTREFKLGVTAGTERTDVRVLDGESNATYGLQAEWTPTERTLLSADLEKRYFGTAHALRFSHRTPNTVWALSDSRDVSSSSSQGSAGFGSAYDLFFRQFASSEPDAVKRDVLVRNYLQANGINPNAVVIGGFLASAATLDRSQSASLGIVGVRNTVTVQVSSRRSERADKLATVLDDLSTTNAVRQRGLTLDWALRLTPQSSITLGGSYQRSDGDLPTQQTTLRSVAATWNSSLSPRSSVSAGARHSTFDGTTPYDENALFAAFRLSF